ncbi:MAG: sigma-70 family RNA polymerase sigma factor [Clostridium sp.]|nr:sigma-70 family RNA polymerase sigma factor [Clostridium sp.]
MNNEDMTKYADFLLYLALEKCGNIMDAQDLAQETMLAALAAQKKKPLDNPKAWLTAVLRRKYYDMLRRKYHKPTVSIDVIGEIPGNAGVDEEIEKSADAENVRRCLAHLTKLYREVMVRYYMHGEKVKDIAAALHVSENTVKSRLDAGRKRIRKEFMMEHYTKQSYEPEMLFMSASGRNGIDEEPFSLVHDDRIAMNLLILAYEKPVTIAELAKAIGISTAYIEPIVERLTSGELMKKIGDKVYTDFIIYTESDRTVNADLEKELADRIYRDVWAVMEQGLKELHERGFYQRQPACARPKLDSFFAVRTMQNAVNNVRNEACGGMMPFEEYPDRPNGGKWFAMGNRYPAGYDFAKKGGRHGKYAISGEATGSCAAACEDGKKKELTLCEYNTLLGGTQLGMRRRLKRSMEDVQIGQMLYTIYSGREELLPMISAGCFENVDLLLERRYLAKEGGRIICAVPVLTDTERWELYDLSERFDGKISDAFHDDFYGLMKNAVSLPAHLKSVPDWLRYMDCCGALPMLMIEKARDHGLFPECRDYPAPAILLSISE